MGKLGQVAIDWTRIAANASRNRLDTEQALRDARAQIRRDIRRWQQQCDADDPNEGAGNEVGGEVLDRLEQQLAEIPARLERLQKSGLQKISRSDPDSRFLRERGGFTLGYTATLAVSEDHLIVGQCVTQETNDNGLLLPMLDLVEQRCGEKVQQASADSGFFSVDNLQALEERNIDGYVPDSNLARWLNRGGTLRTRASDPAHRRMRGSCWPQDVHETQSDRGTSKRNSEGARRHAALPATRVGQSGRRVGPGHYRVQPDAPVASELASSQQEWHP